MTKPFPTQAPPLGLGLAATIFGAVSLLLFFLPVLSIPLGGAGLVFGFGGLALALFGGRASLRWSVVGIAVSVLALSVAVAIAQRRRTICPCTLSRSTPNRFPNRTTSRRPLCRQSEEHCNRRRLPIASSQFEFRCRIALLTAVGRTAKTRAMSAGRRGLHAELSQHSVVFQCVAHATTFRDYHSLVNGLAASARRCTPPKQVRKHGHVARSI